MTFYTDPRIRFAARVLQYLAIQLALIYLSSHQALVTPSFIYQGF
ncbi:MAG TPA: teichoic acid D-Ala incorporation-associated protein DltX [Gemmatimonadales bacterium]|jgi:hypothetical protein